jgi:hypothetical protein
MITTASFLPLAHAAHWYFLPIYLAPVLLVLCGAFRTARSERKARERDRAWPRSPDTRR